MLEYWHARWEYAAFLRSQGLTFVAIASRLGVTRERARQMVAQAQWLNI
jgi:DNA-directed RNA polymerase sigma subunit (sigma70/sigma32)